MNSANGGQQTCRPQLQIFGPLRCIVIDGGPDPTIPVILCHGYGAPGHDLAGLGMEWCQMLGQDAAAIRFVFPEAPLSLADQGMPDGRAWWALNMARLLDLAGTQQFDELHDEEPPGIQAARRSLLACVQAIFADLALDSSRASPAQSSARWGIGGFSQGAMVSLDLVLREDIAPPSLLFQFSGTLVCRPQWEAALPRLAGTRILQSHGTVDPILPIAGAIRLHQILQGSRQGGSADDATIQFHQFEGPHTIDAETVQIAGDWIGQLAASAAS